MRKTVALGLSLGVIAFSSAASAQAFSSLEAINRCDAFVDFALLENFDDSRKQPFKVICYFSLLDPAIHASPEAVCAAHARPYAPATREIAEFVCNGTYHTYRSEIAADN